MNFYDSDSNRLKSLNGQQGLIETVVVEIFILAQILERFVPYN